HMRNYQRWAMALAVVGAAWMNSGVAFGQDEASVLPMDDSTTAFHGVFAGVDGHDASGSYQLVQREAGWQVELSDDFRSDRVPDAYIVLARQPDAITSSSVFVAELDRNNGAQSYQLPEGIDPASFKYVLVWCKKYAVGIGAALIEEEN
ncbi:MAG: DM13 domain-containing protein, partial [Gemmatimonadales bacterium]